MVIDRDPMCSKMIRVSDEVHDMLCSAKIIPQEPYNDCLKRIVAENNYLKRHYISESPRASMERDLKNFVLNPEIPDDLCSRVDEAHRDIWNKLSPNDPLVEGEVIHHINGDHNDNSPENLYKTSKWHHGKLHKQLNSDEGISKHNQKPSDIAFDIKQ